jgi:hypothetical protein
MRCTFAASLGFIGIVLASSGSGAQLQYRVADVERLAGTWSLASEENLSRSSEQRIITVLPESLRIEIQRAEDARPPVLTYRFDGQDAANAFGSGTATSRLIREGETIVTETIFVVRHSPMTVRETFKVSPDGTELTINTTVRIEHGYEGVLAPGESKSPNVSSTARVFRKQP